MNTSSRANWSHSSGLLSLFILFFSGSVFAADPFLQDTGPDNLISIEAENFHDNITRAGVTWQVPSSPVTGFSGVSALQALEDTGIRISTNYATTSAQLSYDVEFVETGRHYIWVRGVGVKGASDSVHVGLDGIESAGGTKIDIRRTNPLSYQWTNGSHFVDVDVAGLHTLDAWFREDGTYIDKIVVSTNPAFVPTGTGPAESFRSTDDQPPVVDPIGPQTVEEDAQLTFTVTASDDNGTPTLGVSGLPSGATFDVNTGLFDWTPVAGDEGVYTVTFTATDSANQTDDEIVEITVTPTGGGDQPPVVDPIGPQTVEEDAQLTFTVTASDDNGTPTLGVSGLPSGATFDVNTGLFDWTPVVGEEGVYTVTFTATDSANQTDDEIVEITVAIAGSSCSFEQAIGGQFLLSIEAENFPGNLPRSGAAWEIPGNPVTGFSGTAALQSLPDNGSAIGTAYSTTAAELSVTADFITAGVHYVWVRGHAPSGGSDSLHVGLDGAEIATSQTIVIPRTSGYEWSNGSHTIDLGTTGVHALQVWMREDGTYFDKIVLTTDPNFTPIGAGPPESSCGANTNDQPPVVDPIGPQTVEEDAQLTFTVTASDDNGTPTLGVSGLPSGATFDVNTGLFDWTPVAGDEGVYTVTFTATDSANQTDDEIVEITVTPVGGTNLSPFLQDTGPDNLISIEAENFHDNITRAGVTWQVPSSPVTGFSGVSALQALEDTGIRISTNYATTSAQLSYDVEFVETGRHYIWVRGVGVKGASDSVHVGLDGIESAGGTKIDIRRTNPLSYQWTNGSHFVDVDVAGLHTLDAWFREDGTYIDKIVVSTNPAFVPTGTGPAESFRSTDDQPPVVDPIGPQTVEEDAQLTFTVTASDDNGTPTLGVSGLPSGATFDVNTGLFDWTPVAGDEGVYTVTFTATDSANQTDDEIVEITVTPTGGGDQPPVVDPIGPQTVEEDAQLTFTVTASDDNGTPTLGVSGLPSGATFDVNTGLFDWTPVAGDEGVYTVTFTATDSANQTDDEIVEITVTPTGGGDQPPVVDPIGPQTVEEDAQLTFTVTASDDNGTPTLGVSGLPSGATFDVNTGLFDWTPVAGDEGVYTVTFTATDSANQTDDEIVEITVTPVGGTNLSPFLQDTGPDNLISIEAENFHDNITRAGVTWQVPSSPVTGFSGVSALQALEDTGIRISTNYATTSAQLSYDVEFVETGRHYIWVRGVGVKGASDSVHVGLDGIESAGGTKIDIRRTNPLSYQWTNGSHFVDVDVAGLHTLDAWFREDGTYIDKIVVSTNPAFVPTGTGPAESFRLSDCQIFPSTRIISPRQGHLQTSTDITVNTATCLDAVDHGGWGVMFKIDGGFAGGGSEQIVTIPPYTATFTGLVQAEHNIEIVLVDEQSVEQSGVDVTDSTSAIGIGDYYVAFGDSITFGFGDDQAFDDTSIDGRNTGGGYTPILNDLLSVAKNYPHTIENEGVPGDTSIDGLAGISAVIARHPDANFYLLKFGMNDARPNTPTPSGLGLSQGDTGYAGTFKDNMQQMIDAILATGAQVALAKVNVALGDFSNTTPYAIPENGARSLNIFEFNLVIDELVIANSLTITPPDFYDYFLQNFGAEYIDNIHPNGIGYDSMAELWAAEL